MRTKPSCASRKGLATHIIHREALLNVCQMINSLSLKNSKKIVLTITINLSKEIDVLNTLIVKHDCTVPVSSPLKVDPYKSSDLKMTSWIFICQLKSIINKDDNIHKSEAQKRYKKTNNNT